MSHVLSRPLADHGRMEVGEHHQLDILAPPAAPALSEDIRTLLAATVIDVCSAAGVPFCSISRVKGDAAVLAAAHGAGVHVAVGAAWRVGDVPPCRQAITTARPVILTARDDPRLTQAQRLSLTGHPDLFSLAFVPLLARAGTAGLLVLADRRPRDLSAEVVRMAPVVRLAAQVLEQDERMEDLARSADDLSLVLDADIEAQSRSAGPDQVLRVVARRLAELCDAPMVDISSLDGDLQRTLVSWSYGRFGRESHGATSLLSQRPLTRAVATTGRAEVIRSLEDPRLSASEHEALRKRNSQSSLTIPLLSSGRVIGIAEVLDNRPHDFTDAQTPALALGEIAAHLLDKALLLETLEQRNVSLREIVKLGARINATSRPEDMAGFVATRLLDVLGAASCEIHRSERGRLRRLVTVDRRGGQDVSEQGASPGLREAGPGIRDHDILVLAGLDDPRLTPAEREMWARAGFAAQLSMPLVIDTRLVGLIDVFDVQSRTFDDHLDFARSVAQLLAGAFDNLLLLERLAESNQQLGVLAESSLEFGSSLDLTEVLHSVASRMCLAASAACCDIYAIEGDALHGLVSTDGSVIDEAFPGTSYQLADFAIARRAIESGKPVVVADIPEDPRLTVAERAEDMRWGFGSLVELPLIDRGEAIGVATLFDLDNAQVARTDLLRGLAQIAAQAIANARVHAALDDGAARLRQINDAGLELSSDLDLGRVLETVARRVCDVAGVDSCDVYTLDDHELRCAASLTSGARDEDWLGSRLHLEDWRASRLAVESRSVIRGAGRESLYAAGPEGREHRHSVRNGSLIVPLLVEQRVIGVVELHDSVVAKAFTDDDVASVESVCRVAAMAIANAELYRDAQLRTRESELLNRVAARAGSSLETTTIAASTVDELATLVPFTDACLLMEGAHGGWEVVYSTSPALEALTRSGGPQGTIALDTLRRERVNVLDLTDVLPASADVPARRLQAALLIGVFIDDALAGALALGAPDREAFDGADREVLERVGALLALSFKNARLYETIKTMHVANLKALISALNARDYYAVGHAARVAAYMLLLGRELGWPQSRLQQITEASFLHDVGRIGISDDVLYKPGRLTDEETAELRRHPIASADIIQPLFSPDIVRAVRHHHERWDGAGYPDGLAGEQIPEVSRALCIVDSYDAMSFQRQHHQALTYAECLSELDHCRGTQFDPAMVTAFMRVLDRLDERRLVARAASEEAAALVDHALLTRLRAQDDETSPEYQQLVKALREVRDQHPGVRFLTTIAPGLEGWRMVCDPEEDPVLRSHPGDPVDRSAVAEDALVLESDRNVLQLDDFGVWVSGGAEIRDAGGALTGLACADLAPADDWPAELGTSGSGHDRTFSAIVESATARLGRARVDAVTDGLTGLYNQRYFKQRLAEEIERAAEQGRQLSLLFCDLDRFKGYNDRLGHVAGDKALRAVAGVVLHSIRQVDLAARYGGEELTVILLDTPGDAALEVAERVRQGVAALDLGHDRGITVSIGAAAFPDHATKVEELIDKADWAMYLAKRKGRDRVISFGHAGEEQRGPEESPDQAAAESTED
jgi:diguanylate cyclase (GGDEF)-like protein